MYYPQECRIGGATYRIVYGSNDLISQYAGYISFRKKQITINDTDTSLTTQKEALLHEIMHGIDEAIGAGNRVSEEENSARADYLFAFMRDDRNKRIIHWIMSEKDEHNGCVNYIPQEYFDSMEREYQRQQSEKGK